MAGKAVFSPIDPLDIEDLAVTDAILTAEGGWQNDLAFAGDLSPHASKIPSYAWKVKTDP